MSNEVKKELLKKRLSFDVIEEARQLWTRLEKVNNYGIVLNAYGSDDEILSDLYDFFCENLEEFDTGWILTYLQIFSWQFQSYHEGVETYYTNFYGNSNYDTVLKTADYLRECGYDEISKWYSLGIQDYRNYKNGIYPDEWIAKIKKIDKWIDSNEEMIFNFMFDVLLKHKDELFN